VNAGRGSGHKNGPMHVNCSPRLSRSGALLGLLGLLAGGSGACGASAPPAPVPPPQDDTTLGPSDVFDVRVYGEEELSGTYRVADDGTIDYPFVGRIEVAGQEPTAVADMITARLRDGQYLVNPQVSIFVSEYNSKRVSVMGAVRRPGTFPVTTGMTAVQAISLAGGLTPLASADNTVVARREGQQIRRLRVPVDEISEGHAEDFPLRPGDIVYVPERVF